MDRNAKGKLPERDSPLLSSVPSISRRSERTSVIPRRSDVGAAPVRVRTVERYSGTTLQSTKTVAYNALGNITSKSHLTGTTTGTYDYATAATCTGVSGQVAPGPHAVRRVTAGSVRELCYDGNGNQLRGWNFTNARTRDLTWTPYNLPRTVTENSQTLTFSYGADRSRFKQVNTFNGETRLYVDGIYEKETVGATSTHVHYIFAGNEAVAVHKSRSDGVLQTRYLHRDHLRSVSGITNETGAVVESYSYDVWGKRRNTNWTDAASQLFSTQTPRGYTGHEQLDHASLVHMNGRVYDPNLGRMLSPGSDRASAGREPELQPLQLRVQQPAVGARSERLSDGELVLAVRVSAAAAARALFERCGVLGPPDPTGDVEDVDGSPVGDRANGRGHVAGPERARRHALERRGGQRQSVRAVRFRAGLQRVSLAPGDSQR